MYLLTWESGTGRKWNLCTGLPLLTFFLQMPLRFHAWLQPSQQLCVAAPLLRPRAQGTLPGCSQLLLAVQFCTSCGSSPVPPPVPLKPLSGAAWGKEHQPPPPKGPVWSLCEEIPRVTKDWQSSAAAALVVSAARAQGCASGYSHGNGCCLILQLVALLSFSLSCRLQYRLLFCFL